MTTEEMDKQKLKKDFKELQDECVWEHGHDCYNGTWSTMDGLEVSSRSFPSEDSAYDYVCEHTEKWGDALAVTVKEDGKEPYTFIGGWAAE